MLNTQVIKQYGLAQNYINKSKQIVFIYDGLIKIIKQAISAMKRNNIQEKYNLLEKAKLIISGLQDSLDPKQDEDVAKLLYDYYLFIYIRLSNADNRYEDTKILDSVINDLLAMRDSWREADEQVTKNKLESELLINKSNNHKDIRYDV